MSGIRIGGKAPSGLTSPPFTVLELEGNFNVWQLINGTLVRLTEYTDPAGVSPPYSEDQSNPVWSPDRSLVAFDENFPGPNGEGQVKTVATPFDAGSETVVSPDDAGGPWFIHPSWRPDSGGLLYIHADPTAGFNGSIVAVDLSAPGTEDVLYTPSIVGAPSGWGPFRPQYNPDGTKIAFILSSEGGSTAVAGLYVMDADGSHVTQYVQFDAYIFDGEQLAWSPDGTMIAYQKRQSPGASFSPFHVIDADGSNDRKVSVGDTDTSPDLGTSVGKRLGSPCWLNDSSGFIAAAQWWDTDDFVIRWVPWRYETDGTTPETRLSDLDGPDGTEFFRTVYVHDGRIWYVNERNPGTIGCMDVDGSNPQTPIAVADCNGDQFYNGTGFTYA